MADAPLAMITGATGGIGGCIARRLSRRGYRLVLLGRDAARLEQLRCDLDGGSGWGPGCVTLSLELGEPAGRLAAVREVLAQAGPIEVLVNNAGYNSYQPFAETAAAEHDRLMQVNYLAAVELTRLALPGMVERGRGWVINIASVSARMGPWGHAAYAGAKAAMIASTQSLAAEHAGTGVHFSYVTPGIVDTGYFRTAAMGGLWSRVRRHAIEPERVAREVEKLLDRPRLSVAIPRHYRVLDWLAAVSPGLAHRLVASQSRPDGEVVVEGAEPVKPVESELET